MTLSERNYFFKGGIVFSALCLVIIGAASYFTFPAYHWAGASAAFRPWGLILNMVANIAEPSAYVPLCTMLSAVLFSLFGIIFIYYYFEQTHSPEIIFIGFFVISLSFELVRVVIPLRHTFSFPFSYLIGASRILLFGRYFGLFSIFAASIYAAGYEAQKQQHAFFILILAALLISLRVPIDSLAWDSSLKMRNGYNSMFLILEAGILVVTLLTFFISAYTRGSRSYIIIGIGCFLLLVGRNLLINSDTWITPFPALVILTGGIWFVCAWLHKEYLWL